MAKRKSSTKAKPKTVKKSKRSAKATALRSSASSPKTRSRQRSKAASAKSSSKRKIVGRKSTTATAAAKRKGGASRAAASAPSHDGVLQRMFDRIKPVFKKPLDPRIKNLVEVFGAEAVVGLMDAYRKKRDEAHRDELQSAMAEMEAKPTPQRHGAWAWHELMTSDVAGAKRFYGEMFGWQATDVEMMPGFSYTTFSSEGKELGGMMAIGPEHGDMPPGWGVYIAVDDVDAAAERAETLGGEIVVPPHDIPVGRWSMVKDPAGAMICVYKAKM